MAKKEETTDVAIPENDQALVAGADIFDKNDNMLGIDLQISQIKIIHQGQMFGFPEDVKKLSFKGTIVDISRTNAYWAKSFDDSGGGEAPTCSSLDGINPEMDSEEVQASSCFGCERNKFGSDGKRGKQCKNMKRIHVLVDGEKIPYRLTVPPSNLKAIDIYVSSLTSKGIPYPLAETEFKLKSVKNKDGIEYSELIMRNVGGTPLVKNREEAQALKRMIDSCRGSMRGKRIVDNEAE